MVNLPSQVHADYDRYEWEFPRWRRCSHSIAAKLLQKARRINPPRVSVRKGINDNLSPPFSYMGLNNDQNVRTMPAMKFVGMSVKVTLPAPWQFQAIIFIDGEWGYRESYRTAEVLKVLATGRVGHWCCAVVVLSRYSGSISPSCAQYVADATNSELCLKHIIIALNKIHTMKYFKRSHHVHWNKQLKNTPKFRYIYIYIYIIV